jgi:hypothetical protein
MSKKPQFPTAIQNVAINLVFAVLSEQRCNRSQEEYRAIMAKLGSLKILTHKINDLLTQLHVRSNKTSEPLPEICRFKAGDQYERIVYENYPTHISYETLRAALEVAGFRAPRCRRSNPL